MDEQAQVAFSPDGKWFVTSSSRHAVWETGTWELRKDFPRPGYVGLPGPIAFTSDGRLMAVFGGRGAIDLIDMDTMRAVARLEQPESGQAATLMLTPDGTSLVYPDPAGNIIHIWDLRAVREQLAKMNLDWDLPPYSHAQQEQGQREPLRVEVDLGELVTPSIGDEQQEPQSRVDDPEAEADRQLWSLPNTSSGLVGLR